MWSLLISFNPLFFFQIKIKLILKLDKEKIKHRSRYIQIINFSSDEECIGFKSISFKFWKYFMILYGYISQLVRPMDILPIVCVTLQVSCLKISKIVFNKRFGNVYL